ncbi:molybdate ABC transporter substrate-binding protein [Thalassospiraceae bacterium LMO-JJ14]|nr:molybdate ABC transporter substrate-binding protein [Thalassospiraceae bacterium LMO-JJ14]
MTVFAAASTQQAVEAVLSRCPQLISKACRGVFAASSTLARQIAGGAPADIYISANLKWMRYLSDNKYVVSNRVSVLASNRLVVVAPKSLEVPDMDDETLLGWLAGDRVAVGDPVHVPAGIYAEQALQALGAWQTLEGHLLRMPNVRAALAVVAHAEANAGIVYATDAAVSRDVKIVYRFDPSLHEPIRYPMAPLTGRDSKDVNRLIDLFLSETGKAAFRAAGFEVAAD